MHHLQDSKTFRHNVQEMFDRISSSYDRGNRILSFFLDMSWRKKIANYIPPGKDLHLVDIATGTCDQLIALKNVKNISSMTGFDLAEEMLYQGRAKLKKHQLTSKAKLFLGNALSIPLDDASVDLVTISFGIRNVKDPLRCLQEMKRVLKQGGRAFILEFSLPTNIFIKPLYLFYLKNILPFVGKLISKDKRAYEYLESSIQSFLQPAPFLEKMTEAGFTNKVAIGLTFGTVTLYMGDAL